jgi:methenyltetrahydromethanopterin cyclohydrolase
MPNLNERAHELANAMAADADDLGISVSTLECGTRIIDCGVNAPGSQEAGRRLAEVCLSGLGTVKLEPCAYPNEWNGVVVDVTVIEPIAACMASQYAGWQITCERFFAMGSGPMRSAGSREPLFDHIGYREQPDVAVGVLETHKLPPADVCAKIAADCKVADDKLTLLVARTASIAGTIQVVARSVETALHKMHEIGFDLQPVASGFGTAPLPPIASDDLVGIGRTNDAVLYGGEVTLWLNDDDARIAALGPKIPSSMSADYGEPFAAIFERYNRDFYKIDPLLFSPASITLVNLASGRAFRFGDTNGAVLLQSFET